MFRSEDLHQWNYKNHCDSRLYTGSEVHSASHPAPSFLSALNYNFLLQMLWCRQLQVFSEES